MIPGETGFLTAVGDAKDMAQAMHRLVNDPSLCRMMGNASRCRIEEHFSLEIAGKTYIDEYDRLLESNSLAEGCLAQ